MLELFALLPFQPELPEREPSRRPTIHARTSSERLFEEPVTALLPISSSAQPSQTSGSRLRDLAARRPTDRRVNVPDLLRLVNPGTGGYDVTACAAAFLRN